MSLFRMYGDWGKAKKLLDALPKELNDVSISVQRSITESLVRKVKAHLKNQDIPGWTPLSAKYADKKMGEYGHEDMLMASLDYYTSIKTWRQNKAYYAGVPKGLHYPNGREISAVAQIHENWSLQPGKPYRPLWSYTFTNDLGGMTGLQKFTKELIKKKLLSKGYPIK